MSDLDLTGYKLTFRDEFNAFSWNSNSDTSSVDQAANGTWSTRYWWGSGIRNLSGNADAPSELQWYSDPSVGPNPFSVADGALRITATRSADPAATGNWPYVSGLITTDATFAQQYGYFEMRAKLPAGQGMLPQVWLLPQDHSWPPEIDVLEAFGSEPNRFFWAAHTGPNGHGDGDWVDVLDDLTNSFHTYGVKWTTETITCVGPKTATRMLLMLRSRSFDTPTAVACFTSIVRPPCSLSSTPRRRNSSSSSCRQVWRES